LIEVEKNHFGKYAKIKAIYPEGEITIRRGLDSLTYVNLKSVFSVRVTEQLDL
jgi:hypothetical protein